MRLPSSIADIIWHDFAIPIPCTLDSSSGLASTKYDIPSSLKANILLANVKADVFFIPVPIRIASSSLFDNASDHTLISFLLVSH